MVGRRVRRVDDDQPIPAAGTVTADLAGAYWVRWDGEKTDNFEWHDDLAPWGPLRLVPA